MGQYYWPDDAPRTLTRDAFLRAYSTLGFRLCFDGNLEDCIEKIAIYGKGPAGGRTARLIRLCNYATENGLVNSATTKT